MISCNLLFNNCRESGCCYSFTSAVHAKTSGARAWRQGLLVLHDDDDVDDNVVHDDDDVHADGMHARGVLPLRRLRIRLLLQGTLTLILKGEGSCTADLLFKLV